MVAYTIYMNHDDVFKALSDRTRRLILDELSLRHEQTMYELCSRLVMKHNLAISRQAVTKHITILETAGLIISVRRGKYRVIKYNHLPIKDILERWIPK